MWISKQFFQMVLDDNKRLVDEKQAVWNTCHLLQGQIDMLRSQKAKDDISIDWLRHRVNALEKEKAALLVSKGIHLPVPEIVANRPGTMSAPPDYGTMPSFDDIGDVAAEKAGLGHDALGMVVDISTPTR